MVRAARAKRELGAEFRWPNERAGRRDRELAERDDVVARMGMPSPRRGVFRAWDSQLSARTRALVARAAPAGLRKSLEPGRRRECRAV